MASILETVGTLKAGNDANEAKKFEAAQLEQKANESKAISQKNAALEMEQAQLIRSSAAAAAGKTGTTGVGSLLDQITAEGRSRALVQLYTGNVEQRNAKIGAAVARIEGKNAKKAAKIKAAADLAAKVEGIVSGRPTTPPPPNYSGGSNNTLGRPSIQGSLQSKYGSKR